MVDAPASSDPSTYDVQIEDVGGSKRRLVITVPSHIIDEKIEESMGTLATQSVLPGFRKGRAPKELLERRFGTTVRDETRNQVIADGYASALEQHEIKPLGDPMPVETLEDLKIEIGKPLTFTVEVEVVPEFDLPSVEDIEIKKPMIEVTDAHIDSEVVRQCTQLGEIQSIDSGFEEGDRVLGPGSATTEGDEEPFFQHDNVDIIIPPAADGGRGHVLGLMIDGLRGMLDGKAVGDTLLITTTGPDSHELENIRGKTLTIEMTIREGQRIIPASVETVVEQYGLGSEEILREQLRLALEQRRDEEQRAAMREQIYEYLAGAVDFELPQRLSDAQAGRMLERQRLELMYRGGLSIDEVESRLAELRAETEEQSRARLKLSFLLHRLAEKFEVSVTDQEINGRIATIAGQRGMRPEKLRADLVRTGGIGSIATQIHEHKAADRVIDQAKVVELTAEEWNTAFVAKQQDARKGKTTKKKTTKKKTTGAAEGAQAQTSDETSGEAASTKTTTSKKKTKKKKKTSAG